MNKRNTRRKNNIGIFVLLIAIVLLSILFSMLAIGMIYQFRNNEKQEPIKYNSTIGFYDSSYLDYISCPLTSGVDTDEDGVFDLCDNCIFYYNPDQRDNDYDGIGNACEHLFAGRDRRQENAGEEKIQECRDNKDNDGDGLIDWPADPGCVGLFDDSEYPFNQPQCSDRIDNDGDGLIDWPADPGCFGLFDDSESD